MELNSAFSFTVDFSDVNPSRKREDLVEGYYKVKITEAYINQERNPNRVIFKLEFGDQYSNSSKLTGLNLPGSTQGDVRGLWLNLMLSAGYSLDQLKSGSVEIKTENIQGREACLYFRPKDESAEEGDLMYDKFTFLPVDNWTSSKASFEAKQQSTGGAPKAAAPSAKSLTAPSTPSAGFAGASVSSADLLNMVKGN